MFWKNELKRYFLSPLFAPVFCLCASAVFVNIILTFFPEGIDRITKDWQSIDLMMHAFYVLLLVTLVLVFRDFKNNGKLTDYFIYFFLTFSAQARELGIQRWLTESGGSAFKTRYMLDPNNPWTTKMIVVGMFATVIGTAAYVLCKHARYLYEGFFRMDVLSWSILFLGVWGVFSKFVDRLCNGSIGKYFQFSDWVSRNVSVTEEVVEAFLPVIGMIILWQYHLLLKKKYGTSERAGDEGGIPS